MMLGIVLHAALSYFLAESGYGVFWPQDDQQSELSRYIFDFIHSWRMPTFFILAGFFAHLVLERRPTESFIKDRLRRIALPFLIFGSVMAAILPTIWTTALTRTFAFINPLEIPLADQAIGHLWFIYHLIYIYVVLLAARWIAGKIGQPLPLCRVLLRVFVNRWQIPLIFLIAFIVLGQFIEDVDDTKLWPIGTFDFAYSIVPFLFGYGLYRRRELIERFAETRFLIATLSAATIAFAIQESLQDLPEDDPLGLVLLLATATATVCYSIGLIGLFQRVFTAQSNWIRWVADSSYWVYIVHLPVVLLVAYSMFELGWHAGLKFLIVCVVTGALGFLTYWLFVRYTPIGAMLNGRRVRGYVVHPPSGEPSVHRQTSQHGSAQA